ncbi:MULTISPECIES: heme-degrading domain-containing protein [Microbacterium]|uniref:heme-degrading domain-containing protein n=1 Tax=Microbacterium TaxID=33882 RepID=UPI00217DC2C5|nr:MULTISPECIES: heme-degrading domain-containing protein [Microbacterium]UWF76968.1 heme-degrading domain-containing protein [Microbacterium neungamense]WCM55128.1 heme-degrading domain-containing protein [Microbacterium sp. EF45047]
MTEELRTRIAEIRAQEERLVLPRFTFDEAWEIGSWLVRAARERGLAITIRIVRGEQVLFHAALPGTSADNDGWATRKANTVSRFGQSSYLVGLSHKASGADFLDKPWNDPARYAAHGGAFPVTVAGVGVVGSVTVSGLAQADDHALVVEALEQHLATARD